ncbi:hypothetical protein GCM10017083_03300 [Thalassobaculum fulvum]|uniref:Nucleotidyltransferase family protein n=1 Tax=Thalassobaculum fulvum TaxID=1633335 RepID=A0A918XPA6_9PROT|nr:nucleotidyltransferase family protein [Thalassobaculum fulvum]GHD40227.1 hypothetical protein GCM10017083_03300 [Thalassobaculum fulvum]
MTDDATGRFAGYWRRALGLDADPPPGAAAEAVARLTPVFGPGLARWPVADLVPPDPSEAADAAFRRLQLARQVETLAALRAAGIEVLAIKGHEAARLYDPPSLRILGDLDLLVRPADAPAAAGALARLGFTVEPSPQGVLGVTSDVSFHPLVSRDGLVSVDLHTALDAFPLSAALPVADVFAQARFEAGFGAGGEPRLAPHHAALAALSNAAKERFAPYAWRHLVDLGRLALRERIDWRAVDRVVAAAGLGPARATALGALRLLGLPAERLPMDLVRSAGARPLARELGELRVVRPGRLAKAVREIRWCYAPATMLRLWRFRVAGLLRPRSGLPPGTVPGEE